MGRSPLADSAASGLFLVLVGKCLLIQDPSARTECTMSTDLPGALTLCFLVVVAWAMATAVWLRTVLVQLALSGQVVVPHRLFVTRAGVRGPDQAPAGSAGGASTDVPVS
jgi:hypothetical protein